MFIYVSFSNEKHVTNAFYDTRYRVVGNCRRARKFADTWNSFLGSFGLIFFKFNLISFWGIEPPAYAQDNIYNITEIKVLSASKAPMGDQND